MFADPNGVINSQELDIEATSFPDAYVKARAFQEVFNGLYILFIEQLNFFKT